MLLVLTTALNVAIVLRGAPGRVKVGAAPPGGLSPESLAKFSTDGFTYDAQLELPTGEYDVRFVVRDKLNGRLGALTAPLTVP